MNIIRPAAVGITVLLSLPLAWGQEDADSETKIVPVAYTMAPNPQAVPYDPSQAPIYTPRLTDHPYGPLWDTFCDNYPGDCGIGGHAPLLDLFRPFSGRRCGHHGDCSCAAGTGHSQQRESGACEHCSAGRSAVPEKTPSPQHLEPTPAPKPTLDSHPPSPPSPAIDAPAEAPLPRNSIPGMKKPQATRDRMDSRVASRSKPPAARFKQVSFSSDVPPVPEQFDHQMPLRLRLALERAAASKVTRHLAELDGTETTWR